MNPRRSVLRGKDLIFRCLSMQHQWPKLAPATIKIIHHPRNSTFFSLVSACNSVRIAAEMRPVRGTRINWISDGHDAGLSTSFKSGETLDHLAERFVKENYFSREAILGLTAYNPETFGIPDRRILALSSSKVEPFEDLRSSSCRQGRPRGGSKLGPEPLTLDGEIGQFRPVGGPGMSKAGIYLRLFFVARFCAAFRLILAKYAFRAASARRWRSFSGNTPSGSTSASNLAKKALRAGPVFVPPFACNE